MKAFEVELANEIARLLVAHLHGQDAGLFVKRLVELAFIKRLVQALHPNFFVCLYFCCHIHFFGLRLSRRLLRLGHAGLHGRRSELG